MGPSGLELSRQPGGVAHTRPWKGGLWDCEKYSFLWRRGGGTEVGRPGGPREVKQEGSHAGVGRVWGTASDLPSTGAWSPVRG